MLQTSAVKPDIFGKASTGKLAMWLFILMDGLTFATLLIGGAALRYSSGSWPAPGEMLNIPLVAFNTLVLIASSFSMVMAWDSVQKGDSKGLVKYLIGTIVLGSIFLSIQAWEYFHLLTGGESGVAFLPGTSVYAAIFYGVTGFHGLHVLVGLIYLACILRLALKGRYGADNHEAVELAGLFWHFVDLIWSLVFIVIYLM